MFTFYCFCCLFLLCLAGIGLSVSASALAMFRTVVKKYRDGPVNVKEVRVVLFDKKMVPQFVGAVQHAGEKHNKSNQGFFNRIKSGRNVFINL